MNAVTQAANLLAHAKQVCILTGAGVSAESGIPTFRDKQTGLWESYRAEELASIDGFLAQPRFVWQWYQWRRNLIKDKRPNAAHRALAQWQSSAATLGQRVTLISQNVDDLHEQAGSTVHKLHGSIWHNHCIDCGAPYEKNARQLDVQALIACPACGGYVRPSVVWFGEGLPAQPWRIAEQAATGCDVFLSIGTSSVVYPAAGLVSLAKSCGAKVIEVNPNPSDLTIVDIQLAYKAGEVLPKLVTEMTKLLEKLKSG